MCITIAHNPRHFHDTSISGPTSCCRDLLSLHMQRDILGCGKPWDCCFPYRIATQGMSALISFWRWRILVVPGFQLDRKRQAGWKF